MENYIYSILIKHFNGTATTEEERAVTEWLSNPDNENEYHEYKEVWKITGKVELFDSNKGWNKFKANLHENSGIHSNNQFRLIPFIKIAATLAVIIATGTLLYYLLHSGAFRETHQYKYVATNEAIEEEIVLPDGSKVWLNQKSILNITKEFGENQRRVKLEGEAFFEVAKDANTPFIIETSRSSTTILGTSFNMRSYEDETEEIISMITGKVEFLSKTSNESIKVEAGKEATLTEKGKITLSAYENKNFLAWKTKRLSFIDEDLTVVITDVERYFNVSIRIENHELKNCKFTGTFVDPTLNNVLETLSAALELEFKRQEEIIHINGKGC